MTGEEGMVGAHDSAGEQVRLQVDVSPPWYAASKVLRFCIAAILLAGFAHGAGAAGKSEAGEDQAAERYALSLQTQTEPSSKDQQEGEAESAKQEEAKADEERAGKEEGDTARRRRARPGARILLPGSKAWKKPPAAPVEQGGSGAASGPAATPREGNLYWSGKLEKDRVITIEATEANLGWAEGDFFPGEPLDVHLPSPAVVLVERPNPENGWKRISFRCLRSTKRSVTINIQWALR